MQKFDEIFKFMNIYGHAIYRDRACLAAPELSLTGF